MDKDDELKNMQQMLNALESRVRRLEAELQLKNDESSAPPPLLAFSASPEKSIVERSGSPYIIPEDKILENSDSVRPIQEVQIISITDSADANPGDDIHPNADSAIASTVNINLADKDSATTILENRILANADSANADSVITGNPTSLEAKIGLYWLSRLGVSFIVLGIAFLIAYSFQYFGPIAKIVTGFTISSLLLALGEFIERKQKLVGYGHALAGGAWSLAYFTAYAMHHIESVRVIQDPLLGAIAMMAVAMAAIAYAFKKNSEMVAVLAVCLGFVTLSVSGLTLFSPIASFILTAALSFMVFKRQWSKLYCAGLMTAFGVLLCSLDPLLVSKSNPDRFMTLFFLAPYVVAGGLLPVFLKDATSFSRSSSAVVNIVAATATCINLMPLLRDLPWPEDALAYGIVAVTWGLFAYVMRSQSCKTSALTNSLIALSSATLFMPALNHGHPTLAAWSLELAIVAWAGMKFGLRSFRYFALGLAFVLSFACLFDLGKAGNSSVAGLAIPNNLLTVLPSLVVLFALSSVHQSRRFKDFVSNTESNFSFYWYFHLAGMLSAMLVPAVLYRDSPAPAMAGQVLVILYAIQSFAAGYLGQLWKRPYLSGLSMAGFFVTGCCLTVPGAHQVLSWSMLIGLMYLLAFQYRKSLFAPDRLFFHFLFSMAALFTLLTPPPPSDVTVATIWSAELLVLAGLYYKLGDSLFKYLASCVALVLFFFLLSYSGQSWALVIASSASIFVASHFLRQRSSQESAMELKAPSFTLILSRMFNVGASIILANFIGAHLQNGLVSVGWAAEGLLLLAAGFIYSDKVMRMCGLLAFSMVAFRLLFIDLSGANTVFRIISFIVAGVVFMLTGYAYAWFSKRFEQSKKESQSSESNSLDANSASFEDN